MKKNELSLPSLFSDGMIVQRNTPLHIWGTGIPGSAVTAVLTAPAVSATVDSAGRWSADLPPVAAGGSFTLTVSSDRGERIVIRNILAGDVWLCSGQSNMELPMERLKRRYPEEMTAPPCPQIRQFKIPVRYRFDGTDDDVDGGNWQVAASDTIGDFSGMAWFFAKELYNRYHVPIGIINASHGGSPAESWLDEKRSAAFPALKARAERFANREYCAELEQTAARNLETWYAAAYAQDTGIKNGWHKEQLPESESGGWFPVELPGRLPPADGNPVFCGVRWLRRSVTLPDWFCAHDAVIELGVLVDADTVYINGIETGTTGYMYPPRIYPVPAGALHCGENTIVIKLRVDGVHAADEFTATGEFVSGKPYKLSIRELPDHPGECSVDLRGTWYCRTGCLLPPKPPELFLTWEPFCLYNAMIAPVEPYPVCGVLWYQGESNTGRRDIPYSALFESLVNGWRANRNAPALPFIAVQLPGFKEPEEIQQTSTWADLRQEQLQCCRRIPATGLVSAIDCGEWNDLHPLNKKTVGQRAAAEAFRVAYGETTLPFAPYAVKAVRNTQNPSIITVVFVTGGSDLTDSGGNRDVPVRGFAAAAAGGIFIPVPALIKSAGHTVELDCSAITVHNITQKLTIRYAWADCPRFVSLYNTFGFPAYPFEITVTV